MYDLITFDIFDTLVHRRLRAPVDIFEATRLAVLPDRLALLNHDILAAFSQHRQLAESEARRLCALRTGGEGEVTFSEIYDTYQSITGCSAELRRLLADTELKMERHFLYASRAGLAEFATARKEARQIAFISDMYLSSDFLSTLLEAVGFRGARGLPIFVSGEERCSKHSGALYERVRQRLQIAPEARWLHVGDNLHADIEMARRAGLQTRTASWARVDNRWQPGQAPQRDYLARSLAEFSSLPQAGQFLPEEPYARAGYRIFGPLIFGFVLWLLAQARAHRAEHIAFIARDGWLPGDLFSSLKAEAGLADLRQSYVYFSRAAGLKSGLRGLEPDTIMTAVGGRNPRSLSDVIETLGASPTWMMRPLEQFGFSAGAPPLSQAEQTQAGKAICSGYPHLLNSALAHRRISQRYFRSLFRPDERTLLVDIGWNGNIQNLLTSCLGPDYDRAQFTGLYLGLHPYAAANRARGHQMFGWLSHFDRDPEVTRSLLSGGVELLEFALTADHGTTLGYQTTDQGEVKPVLEPLQPEEQSYRELAMRVQSGIRLYVEHHRWLLQVFQPEMLASTAWRDRFIQLVDRPDRDEIALFAGLTHSDSAGSTSVRRPLAMRQPVGKRIFAHRLARARGQSFWLAAFDQLNA